MSTLLTGATATRPVPGPTTTPQGEGTVPAADFDAVFLRFQGPITNFIYHLTGNREQACDLAQDVFVKAYKALLAGTAIPAASLSAWLYRIAANTTTDALRRRRLIAWLPLSLYAHDRGIGAGIVPSSAGSHTSTEDGAGPEWMETSVLAHAQGGYSGGCFEDRVADREILGRVFGRLQPKYAICLWLYYHDGRSCAEIAQTLSITPSAVKMRLMRAREYFFVLYRQETGEGGAA